MADYVFTIALDNSEFSFDKKTWYTGDTTATKTSEGTSIYLYVKALNETTYPPFAMVKYKDTTTGADNTKNISNTIPDEDTTKNRFLVLTSVTKKSDFVITDRTGEKFTVTTILTNATCNIADGTEIVEGTQKTITVTAAEGYYFSAPPFITIGENELDMTTEETDEPKNYSYTLTVNDNFSVTAVAEVIPPPQYQFNVDVTNATCNISPDTVYHSGETVHIEVVADNGYYFSTAPTLKEYVLGTTQTHVMFSDDTGDYKKHFYYDFLYAGTSDLEYEWNRPTITANAQVMPKVDKYGIITMYNPTPSQLKEIGNVRYMGTTDSAVDLGNYISNLIKVYVKIPQGDTANVLLGGYDTNVAANVVLDDIIETDCGTVAIVGNYNNAMDYQNTKIEMYLPFIGFVTLETEKVMNETLSLIYKTNILNGDSIACIYNTTGTLLYTFNCNASFEIPYRLNADIEAQGKLDINSNYLFGFTPFVTVRYNKAYGSNGVIANDDLETTLENLTGYVKCSEIFNTIKAPRNEKEEIENILKGGILL